MTLIALACYALLLATAAVYDFAALRLPNPLTFGIVALFALRVLADPFQTTWLGHLGAGLLVLTIAAVLFALRLIGGGDAKLLAGTALWTGLATLPAFLVTVAVLGGVLALLLLSLRPLLWPFLAQLPSSWARWIPRALAPGAGMPYGVPIALAAILDIMSWMPLGRAS